MNPRSTPLEVANRSKQLGGSVAILLGLAAAAALAFTVSLTGCAEPSNAKSLTPEAKVARGGYLATIGGCNDCHTPFIMGKNGPEPDMTRMLSGHPAGFEMPPAPNLGNGPWLWVGAATNTAFAGPWGVSFARNLTPDPATGLVIDEATFIRAMRTGKHYGAGRPINPPMPWMNYAKMTDEDLGALFAYLRSIPAVENEVPEPLPPSGAPLGNSEKM